MIREGTYMFSASGGEEAANIEAARHYIQEHNLTADDVKIVKINGSICVIARRDIDWQ